MSRKFLVPSSRPHEGKSFGHGPNENEISSSVCVETEEIATVPKSYSEKGEKPKASVGPHERQEGEQSHLSRSEERKVPYVRILKRAPIPPTKPRQ